MQVIAFDERLNEIASRLRLKELVAALMPIMQAPANVGISGDQRELVSMLLVDSLQAAETVRRDPALGPVLETLPLVTALERPRVLRMITAVRTVTSVDDIRSGNERVNFWHLYSSSQTTLGLVAAVESLLVRPKIKEAKEDESIVELEVADYDGHGISVDRLDDVLSSLTALSVAIGQAINESSELRLSYADSGSDIGLGIIAKKLVTDALRTLFRDGWYQVRFWREIGFDRQLESLGKGLTFLSELQAKTETGAVSPETARRINNATVTSMEKLIGAGVTLREEEDYVPISRKQLIENVRNLRRLGPGESKSTDTAS